MTHTTNSTTFELLQPVEYKGTTGYISFISEFYLTICFIDIPLPESANSRWGRHYANLIVYPHFYHEIRSRVDEEQEEGYIAPASNIFQYRRRHTVGTTHQQDGTRKD